MLFSPLATLPVGASNPNAPDGYETIIAKIDDESIGSGTVTGGNFTITADPGTVEYIGKDMIFHIGEYISQTKIKFESDGFKAKTSSNKNHSYKNNNINLNYLYKKKNNTFNMNYYQSDGKTEYDSFGSNLNQDHKDAHMKVSWMTQDIHSHSKFIFIDKQNKIDQADSSATDFTHTKTRDILYR